MKNGIKFRRRLVIAVMVTLFGCGGFGAYNLRVDEIRVTGLRTLDPRKVIETSGLKGGERLLLIRLSSVTRRVERMPAVASVTAERSFPQTVVIRVRERAPLARLGDPSNLSVDLEGRIFASPFSSVLPLVEGWKGRLRPGGSVDRVSAGVLGAFAEFPQELRRATARITVGPPLTLALTDGTEIRFGYHVDLVRKAVTAQTVLAAEGGRELAYVDVRSLGVPVSRRRDPPTPVPTTRPPQQTARPTTPPAAPTPSPAPAASPAPTP